MDDLSSRNYPHGVFAGAAMAFQVGLRNQDRIAGVLLMSGHPLDSEEWPVSPCEGALPIGVFHGSDDEVVQIGAAEGTVEAEGISIHRRRPD